MSEITRERLLKSFRLDEEAGIFYWQHAPKYHSYLLHRVAGRCTTERTGKKYWQVKIDNVSYKRSRLVFLMIHGKLPTPCVDHINGNSLDDRPCNLREATLDQNAQNRKIHKKSTDLPRGVKQVKTKYVAVIHFNKKQRHIGTFDTIEKANDAYISKRKEYYGEFAEY
jgi:hypothetical protein